MRECVCSSLLLVSPWTREKEKLKVKAVYQTTARLRALLLYRTGTRTLLVRVALQSTIVLHLTSPRGIFVSGTVHISRLSEPVIETLLSSELKKQMGICMIMW